MSSAAPGAVACCGPEVSQAGLPLPNSQHQAACPAAASPIRIHCRGFEEADSEALGPAPVRAETSSRSTFSKGSHRKPSHSHRWQWTGEASRATLQTHYPASHIQVQSNIWARFVLPAPVPTTVPHVSGPGAQVGQWSPAYRPPMHPNEAHKTRCCTQGKNSTVQQGRL